MKKLLILTATLLTGGIALPAAAQGHRHQSSPTTVFVSGYLPCGSPIFSKRVRYGRYYQTERLSGHELRRYHERQRRLNAQRELQRRLMRERMNRTRYGNSNRRRCR